MYVHKRAGRTNSKMLVFSIFCNNYAIYKKDICAPPHFDWGTDPASRPINSYNVEN